MRHFACAALAASLASLASPLAAQSQPAAAELPSPADVSNRDTVTVGVGAGILPDYEGSDDYRIIPVAAIRGHYHGISFTTRGTYLYVDVVAPGAKVDLDAGPIAGVRVNSRKNIDDEVVKLIPDLSTVFEAGAFAGVSLHGVTNPYDTLAFRLDVLHGFGSDRNWTNFSPNIEFSTPVSRRTYVGLSAGAEFVGNRFADYYYSITPAQSAATGGLLPVYDADSGLKNWKLGLLVNQSITGDLLGGFSLFGAVQYSRLVGDFADSPIVSRRGSSGQWLAAGGLAYTW
jgi:outer membrane scaffolding protein for murein synthesis (MipA/OmpV family)